MAFAYGLLPSDRGLARTAEGAPTWAFPEDYVARLCDVLIEANPEYRRAIERAEGRS